MLLIVTADTCILCIDRSPVKASQVSGDPEGSAVKSSPSKSSTPSKVPEVTTSSSPAKDASLLDPKDSLTVDTGPTPPITPDRDNTGKPAESEGSPKGSLPDKQQSSSENAPLSDGQTPGSGKKGRKEKTPQKKSPGKQSPSKSLNEPTEVSKENQDPVKDGDTKKDVQGSESEKPADATSTTSTGGVQTSGSEDVAKGMRQPKPSRPRPRPNRPRKPKPADDGGLLNPPFKDNLPKKEGEESGEVVEGETAPVDGESGSKPEKSPRTNQRGPRGPRGPRPPHDAARPGYYPAKKTQPRVVNTLKSGDESAPDGDKKVTTSDGGPTEGSGTETDKPAPRRRNRNRNRMRGKKTGGPNHDEGAAEDGALSDTPNGHSSPGDNRDKTEGGEGKQGGEVRQSQPRRRRGPRGPPRERRDSDPEAVGDNAQQPPRRDGYGGRGRGGWRPRGGNFFGGRGRGGSGHWNNDRVGDRRDDRHHGGPDVFRESSYRRETDDNRPRHVGGYQRRENDDRPPGGFQRRDNFNRDNFSRDQDVRSSYPGGGGYPARSYGNSNFGRGGANYSGGGGAGGGSQGYRGRGGGGGGFRYSENRAGGGGGGFNPRGGSGRQYGPQSDNPRYSSDRPSNRTSSHNYSQDGVTPIDVKGLPGQGSAVPNTHQGGFWNA